MRDWFLLFVIWTVGHCRSPKFIKTVTGKGIYCEPTGEDAVGYGWFGWFWGFFWFCLGFFGGGVFVLVLLFVLFFFFAFLTY